MLQVSYVKDVPCTLYETLSQYYDSEHVATVHPRTLGRIEMISSEDEGSRIVYEHVWPGGRRRSRVVQKYSPPSSMTFDFIAGRYRGVRVETRLESNGPATTRIHESYFLPGLPDWRWLAALVRPFVMRPVERIWKEDLGVGVCIDGWPGLPAAARAHVPKQRQELAYAPLPVGFAVSSLRPLEIKPCSIDGRATILVRVGDRLRKLPAACPHTGGPLALGRIQDNCIVCPWHAATFDLESGKRRGGARCADLPVETLDPCSRHLAAT
jgi:nitrite reductase/ring-hydroxylating ferredoxin subunit